MDRRQDSQPGRSSPAGDPMTFTARVVAVVKVVVLAGLIVALLISAASVFLLVFAGILIAVFLRGSGDWVAARTSLSTGWATFTVVIVFVGLAVGAASLIIPHAVGQFDQLGQEIAVAVDELMASLEATSWGKEILQLFPDVNDLQGQAGGVVQQARGVFSTTIGALASLFVILFIGFYLAAAPGTYTNGVVRLFPVRWQPRVREVMLALQITLSRWLVGRLIGIVVVGLATWIGLMLLGIRLALTLGLLAALLAFIPFLGPVLSAIPAVLLALVDGPEMAFWVVVLYGGIQALESYLLTPLVARQAVLLPPALTIVVQIVMGMYFGIFGVLLAAPASAVILVVVKMTYLEDVLGEEINLPGRPGHVRASDGEGTARE